MSLLVFTKPKYRHTAEKESRRQGCIILCCEDRGERSSRVWRFHLVRSIPLFELQGAGGYLALMGKERLRSDEPSSDQ